MVIIFNGMKRKLKKYVSSVGILCILATLNSCMKEMIDVLDADKYTNLYIPQANQSPRQESIYIREEEQILSFSVYHGGAEDPAQDIRLSVDFAIDLVPSFNAEKGTNYMAMPQGSYVFESKEAIIAAGQPHSSLINMKIKSLDYIDAFVPYLLPVRITDASDGTALHPQMSTIYFLIAGSFEPGHVPTEKVLQLQDDNVISIFEYHGNLITQSEGGNIRLYPYLEEEEKFGSGGIINTGWNSFDVVLPFLDRWVVRYGSWTGGNNGFLNSYAVTSDVGSIGLVSGWFSGGFQIFDLIIPYRGNLLCRLPNGDMRRYPLNNDYVFGSMQLLSTGGWHNFTQIIPYKNTLLCVDASGNMWEFPVSAEGMVSSRRQVGSGWNIYERIVPFGEDLLGIDENNNVYSYKFNPIGFWALK